MRRILPFLFFIHLYVALSLGLGLPRWLGYPLWAVLIVSMVLLQRLAGRRGRWATNVDWRDWLGWIALGALSVMATVTILRDLSLVAMVAAGWVLGRPISSDFTDVSAVWALSIALLVVLVGFGNARRVPRVRHVEVVSDRLAPSFDGFTIAQLSDLHVGPTIRRAFVEAVVERVNGLKVDLVALTGDIVDGPIGQLRTDAEPLRRLSAAEGVLMVTGNHEYYCGAAPWVRQFEDWGIRVLSNDHVVVERATAAMVIAGIPDPAGAALDVAPPPDVAKAVGTATKASYTVLLAHQPRLIAQAAGHSVDLQLSGHTHGGQFLPWPFFVRLQQPYTSGLHRLGDLSIYVSRGTGYWGPPLRFGAPSEISLITLRRGID